MRIDWNIRIVAEMMKADKKRYIEEYDKAEKERDKALEDAKKGFIGQKLKEEIERINKEFDGKIRDLRIDALTGSMEAIDGLRKQEMQSVQGIDKATVEKINVLKDVPMTTDEFVALMDDVSISSNYWAKRALISIAEKNNISVTDVGIGSTYTTKLSVLEQLQGQLKEVLEFYPSKDDRTLKTKLTHVNLSENVVARAVAIYDGSEDFKTAEQKADASWRHIKTRAGDIEQGFSISNALRNAKTEGNRNRLLYNISTDAEISDFALQLSGHYDEIIAFRNNSAKDYSAAVSAMDRVRESRATKESVDMVLSENVGNNFFAEMYHSEIKTNASLYALINTETE